MRFLKSNDSRNIANPLIFFSKTLKREVAMPTKQEVGRNSCCIRDMKVLDYEFNGLDLSQLFTIAFAVINTIKGSGVAFLPPQHPNKIHRVRFSVPSNKYPRPFMRLLEQAEARVAGRRVDISRYRARDEEE